MRLYTSLTPVWSKQLSALSCKAVNLSSLRLEHASLGCVFTQTPFPHDRNWISQVASQVRLLYTCWQESFPKSEEYAPQLLCNMQQLIALFSAQSQRCIWATIILALNLHHCLWLEKIRQGTACAYISWLSSAALFMPHHQWLVCELLGYQRTHNHIWITCASYSCKEVTL